MKNQMPKKQLQTYINGLFIKIRRTYGRGFGFFGIAGICILALIIRIAVLTPVLDAREHPDILRWKDWSRIALLYGMADTYSTEHIQFGTLPNCMPPGTLYVQYGMYLAGIQISKVVLAITQMPAGSIVWLNGPLITLMFRMPSILCDFLIGIVIFFFLKHVYRSGVKPYIGMAFFLFNPVVWFNSAYKGQMDAIVNIFFIVSLYVLLFRKNVLLSMICFLCSLFVKLSLIYFTPFLCLLWYTCTIRKRFFSYGLITVGVGYMLLLPLGWNPFQWIGMYLNNNAIGEMTNITAYAFNAWWMVFAPHAIPEGIHDAFSFSTMHLVGSPLDAKSFLGIPLFWWAIGIFCILSAPIFLRMRKKLSAMQVVQSLFMVSFIAFLVLPRMHERYLYPVMPLLSILAPGSTWFTVLLLALSMANLMNIYIVWHPVTVSFFPYAWWGSVHVQWMISVGIVVLFFLSYIVLVVKKR